MGWIGAHEFEKSITAREIKNDKGSGTEKSVGEMIEEQEVKRNNYELCGQLVAEYAGKLIKHEDLMQLIGVESVKDKVYKNAGYRFNAILSTMGYCFINERGVGYWVLEYGKEKPFYDNPNEVKIAEEPKVKKSAEKPKPESKPKAVAKKVKEIEPPAAVSPEPEAIEPEVIEPEVIKPVESTPEASVDPQEPVEKPETIIHVIVSEIPEEMGVFKDFIDAASRSPQKLLEFNAAMAGLDIPFKLRIKEVELVRKHPVADINVPDQDHHGCQCHQQHIEKEVQTEPSEPEPARYVEKPVDAAPIEKNVNLRLTASKCPHCEKLNYQKTDINSPIKCNGCGKEYTNDLIYTFYMCESCGAGLKLFVGKGIDSVHCVNCQSPIDLVYHQGKKMMLSLNQIGKH